MREELANSVPSLEITRNDVQILQHLRSGLRRGQNKVHVHRLSIIPPWRSPASKTCKKVKHPKTAFLEHFNIALHWINCAAYISHHESPSGSQRENCLRSGCDIACIA